MSPRCSGMQPQRQFLAKSAKNATLTFWDSGKLDTHFSTFAERFFLKSAVVGLGCNYYMASRWNTMHLGEVKLLSSEPLRMHYDAARRQVFLPKFRSMTQLEGLVMHFGNPTRVSPGGRGAPETGRGASQTGPRRVAALPCQTLARALRKRWRCSTGLDRTPLKRGRERPWVAPRPRHLRAFGLSFSPFWRGPFSLYFRPRKRGRIRERFATWKNDLTPGSIGLPRIL